MADNSGKREQGGRKGHGRRRNGGGGRGGRHGRGGGRGGAAAGAAGDTGAGAGRGRRHSTPHRRHARGGGGGGRGGDGRAQGKDARTGRPGSAGGGRSGGSRGSAGGRAGGGGAGGRAGGRKGFFPEHWAERDIAHALETGGVVKGRLRVNKKRRTESFVDVEGLPMNVYIADEVTRNRALEGDVVAVEFLPFRNWPERNRKRAAEGGQVATRAAEDSARQAAIAAAAAADATGAGAGAGAGAGSGSGAGEGGVDDATDAMAALGIDPDRAQETVKGLWCPSVDTDVDVSDMVAVVAQESKERKAATAAVVDKLVMRKEASRALKACTHTPVGRVVGIIEQRHPRHAVGVLRPVMAVKVGESLPPHHKFARVEPLDNRVPFILVPRAMLPDEFVANPLAHWHQLWAVKITRWGHQGRFPLGELRRNFGRVGDIEAETAALLHEHEISDEKFSPEVLASLSKFRNEGDDDISDSNWRIPAAEIAKRRDLRSARIFTIDPPSARDLDDALHVTKLDDGTFEVGVHIADVSYFVRPGSAVDLEAQERCTSTYLVQRVIPMLPRVLCENLCSLNPKVDRLAFSCIWRMRADGNVVPGEAPWFGRTVIRSCAKLDYGTAQNFIDGLVTKAHVDSGDVSEELWPVERRPEAPHTMQDVIQDVLYFQRIAKNRRAKRFESGAVSLNRPALYIQLDEARLAPTGVKQYPIRDSNRLIEEFMLCANFLTAQHLIIHAGSRAVLRRHPPPSGEKMEQLMEASKEVGAVFRFGSSLQLHRSLQALSKEQRPEIFAAIATLAMQVAQYFAVADKRANQWRHYALNIPYYTHFTSPIRRYADVMVHRLLQASLEESTEAMAAQPNAEVLEAQCQRCNDRKSAADAASDDSSRVFMCLYLKDHPTVVPAVVLSVGLKSFTVYEPRWGLQKMVYVDKCGAVGALDEEAKTLTLRPAGTAAPEAGDGDNTATATAVPTLQLRVMTPVTVRLVANMERLPIDFEMQLMDTEAWRKPAEEASG